MPTLPSWQTTMLQDKTIDAASKTVAWTLDAGSHRKVFVVLNFENSTNTPTSMTYAGVALTKLGTGGDASNDMEIWVGDVADSVSGSQNLVITCAGTPSPTIHYYAFSIKDAGVVSTPTFATGTYGGGAKSQSLTAPVYSLLLGMYYWQLSFGYDAKSANQTQRYLYGSGAADYELLTTGDGTAGGLFTFTLTMDQDYNRAYIMTMIYVAPYTEVSGVSAVYLSEYGVM